MIICDRGQDEQSFVSRTRILNLSKLSRFIIKYLQALSGHTSLIDYF